MNPTIVINAYNRPESLRRLLGSLALAYIPPGVELVFSLEYNCHADVALQAESFSWPYGDKTIIHQKSKLGLVGHFFYCGGLTERYGTIVYLEDDLFVGKGFYQYAQAVVTQYGEEESLAGFSLNALWFNGYLHLPFKPVDDGNPVFFLQVPWYQGQVYTRSQWAHFSNWYNGYKGIDDGLQLHHSFKNYQLKDDWFPVKTQYLVATGKYYCFPRSAQCVNFGDAGTHFASSTNFFQTELALDTGHNRFRPLADCLALYDSFFELQPTSIRRIAPHLADLAFETDLHGTKDWSLIKAPYAIIPFEHRKYLQSFGCEMRPHELNLIYNIPGTHFHLVDTTELKNVKRNRNLYLTQFRYFNRFKLTRQQRFRLFSGR